VRAQVLETAACFKQQQPLLCTDLACSLTPNPVLLACYPFPQQGEWWLRWVWRLLAGPAAVKAEEHQAGEGMWRGPAVPSRPILGGREPCHHHFSA